MPWRLIVFIVIFFLFLGFIALNIENRSDVNFGFKSFSSIPVYVIVFFSFAAGLLCSLFFIISLKKKAKESQPKDKKHKKEDVHAGKGKADGDANGIN